MPTIISKNKINIGAESVVILPLARWEVIQETIEDLEDAIRYEQAFSESRGQKLISFEDVKKKYNLK
ncbi:hypothetical protein L6252_02295 [Candidatus Parcubacteria bacterium]|nr:hypothetical protein [Candidatus Parcubacteria bacterium]